MFIAKHKMVQQESFMHAFAISVHFRSVQLTSLPKSRISEFMNMNSTEISYMLEYLYGPQGNAFILTV